MHNDEVKITDVPRYRARAVWGTYLGQQCSVKEKKIWLPTSGGLEKDQNMSQMAVSAMHYRDKYHPRALQRMQTLVGIVETRGSLIGGVETFGWSSSEAEFHGTTMKPD